MLRNELSTLFRRRRIQALLLALTPCRSRSHSSSGSPVARTMAQGPTFLAQVTHNGVFAALAGLTITLPVFLPMAVAVVAGDAIAGEGGLGTLRYLLVRPAGRSRLLAVKATTVSRLLPRGDVRGGGRRPRYRRHLLSHRPGHDPVRRHPSSHLGHGADQCRGRCHRAVADRSRGDRDLHLHSHRRSRRRDGRDIGRVHPHRSARHPSPRLGRSTRGSSPITGSVTPTFCAPISDGAASSATSNCKLSTPPCSVSAAWARLTTKDVLA